jgi:hypothetical protein
MGAPLASYIARPRRRITGVALELDGVLYCHASPRRDDEMLTRLSSPERWTDDRLRRRPRRRPDPRGRLA